MKDRESGEREASRAQAIAALRETGLVVTPEWPASPVVSPEERARLAQKISAGQPLSEIIITNRADRR
jgi:hypothetical protein